MNFLIEDEKEKILKWPSMMISKFSILTCVTLCVCLRECHLLTWISFPLGRTKIIIIRRGIRKSIWCDYVCCGRHFCTRNANAIIQVKMLIAWTFFRRWKNTFSTRNIYGNFRRSACLLSLVLRLASTLQPVKQWHMNNQPLNSTSLARFT